MREPAKIVAAVEIATAVRRALVEETERQKAPGWDADVLLIELGRVLGGFMRWQDMRPSEVEHLVEWLRRVYAGINSHHNPDVDALVRELCPEDCAETSGGEAINAKPVLQ